MQDGNVYTRSKPPAPPSGAQRKHKIRKRTAEHEKKPKYVSFIEYFFCICRAISSKNTFNFYPYPIISAIFYVDE